MTSLRSIRKSLSRGATVVLLLAGSLVVLAGGLTTATSAGAVTPRAVCDFSLNDDSYDATENVVFDSSPASVLDNDELCGEIGVPGILDSPADGTVVMDSDGTFTYTPDHDFVGEDSFVYGFEESDEVAHLRPAAPEGATVTIDVASDCNFNLADDSYSTTENDVLTIVGPGVLSNDSLCGESGDLFAEESPTHGTLSDFDGGDGGFEYTPDPGYVGPDSFQYLFDETDGLRPAFSEEATVTIDVVAECDFNLANDSYGTTENGVLAVAAPGVLANDTLCDQDGTLRVEDPPSHGTVTDFDNGDGGFTYTPDPGYSGPDSFGYVYDEDTVRPADTQTEATVTIDVAPTGTPTSDYIPVTIPTSSAPATTTTTTEPTELTAPPSTEAPTTTTPALTTVTSTEPPTTSGAVSGVSTTTGTTALARTGTNVGPITMLGLGLIALGGLLAAEGRRRRAKARA